MTRGTCKWCKWNLCIRDRYVIRTAFSKRIIDKSGNLNRNMVIKNWQQISFCFSFPVTSTAQDNTGLILFLSLVLWDD